MDCAASVRPRYFFAWMVETMDTATGVLKIKKFDPRKMVDHCVVLLVAKRRSGKSELVKDLMYYKRNMHAGIVMSATEAGNGFYSKWVPPCFVYNHFDKEALERLVRRQKKLTKEGKAQACFVILDDCAFDKKVMNDKIMRELLFNGRHYKISLYILTQYATDLHPSLRSNLDFIIALKENMYREKLFKNFFSIFPNLSTFNAVADELTKNFGAIVLDNTASTSKLSDNVYWYRAKIDRKPWRLGTPEAWAFSKRRYRDEDEDDGQLDPKKLSTPKTIVTVKRVG